MRPDVARHLMEDPKGFTRQAVRKTREHAMSGCSAEDFEAERLTQMRLVLGGHC